MQITFFYFFQDVLALTPCNRDAAVYELYWQLMA
jgi:hypothetical protein